MDDRPLIVIAGDQGEPLDHTLLRPLAVEEDCDVVATYVDEFKSGHPFLFDVVLKRGPGALHHAGYEHVPLIAVDRLAARATSRVSALSVPALPGATPIVTDVRSPGLAEIS